MAGTEGGRLLYADILRVAAIFGVVVLHLAGSQMGAAPVDSEAWAVFNVYDGLMRWTVPVFVMLSGMFLLDPQKGLTYGALFFHHILRLVVALLAWGTVYAVLEAVLSGGLSLNSLAAGLRSVLWGQLHYHLWFLPMILGLYLVTPILRAFVRGAGRADFHWLFLLFFLVQLLLPTLLSLRPSQTLSTWVNRLDLRLVLGYMGYYVLGYYLKSYTLGRLAELLLYGLGILGAVATVWGTRRLSLRAGAPDYTLYGYFTPNVALMAVAVFVLFRYLLGVSQERSRQNQVVGLSKLTFGIYLCHDLFIMLLRRLEITTLSFNPALAVPALSLLVFVLSALLVWPLSKIPLVGRLLT